MIPDRGSMAQGDVSHPFSSCDSGSGRREPVGQLIAGFVAAFLVACIVALLVGHYTLQAPRSLIPFSSSVSNPQSHSINPVTDTFVVSSAGLYRKAVGGERLNPVPGQDYVLFVWVKLRRIPAHGEIYSVVGKFDAQVPNKPGFALSLEGAPDGVRPRVYLSAGSGGGHWYSFAAHPMTRKNWYLFSMALSDDTYVSTYVAQHGSEQGPAFLGGYKMRLPSLPFSASDISVGALGTSRFRGHIGPFGVLSAKDLQQDLLQHLAEMQADPNLPPRRLPQAAVRLWATPSKDQGPAQYSIVQEKQSDPQSSAPMPKAAKKSGAPKAASKSKKAAGKVAKKAPPSKKSQKGRS